MKKDLKRKKTKLKEKKLTSELAGVLNSADSWVLHLIFQLLTVGKSPHSSPAKANNTTSGSPFQIKGLNDKLEKK